MTLAINLSTTHDYSIDDTIAAFVTICNQHNRGCLRRMPGFFQNFTNDAWVKLQLKLNYASVIEPYKLGKINTEQFLDKLAEIFNFMDTMDEAERTSLLITAWNSSIKITEKTKGRFAHILDSAKEEPVYLISNTNELNVRAILDLFKEKYPALPFNENIDISMKYSQEPVELLPNIYLCLSYRFGVFKTEGLLKHLSDKISEPLTVVSQHHSDTAKAEQLELNVQNPDDFYYAVPSISMMHD